MVDLHIHTGCSVSSTEPLAAKNTNHFRGPCISMFIRCLVPKIQALLSLVLGQLVSIVPQYFYIL